MSSTPATLNSELFNLSFIDMLSSKIKKCGVFIFSAIVLLTACQKDDIQVIEDNFSSNIETRAEEQIKMRMLIYIPIYNDYPPFNQIAAIVFCTSIVEGNCFPDVDVSPSASVGIQSAYSTFIQHFKNDNLKDYFSNENYGILFPHIDNKQDVVVDLQNGKLTLIEEFSEGEDSKVFYIGVPSDKTSSWSEDDVRCVLPVIVK